MSVESSGNKVRTTPVTVAEKSVSVAATGAIFTAHDGPDGSLVVAVHGDIDMRSAPMFSDFVRSRVSSKRHVTLDLSNVEFFGIAGLTVFDAVRDYTAGIGASWSIVAGRSVSRLLRAADLESSIPTTRPSSDQ
ncbi:STAS domain-containing protein [Rhodococcus sp. 077-4]|uniref:STAS domain-containing protein n=1 Tax=Rhodococcus sp. 077-4 TaxID=2789271 RepID=UPI0039F5F972